MAQLLLAWQPDILEDDGIVRTIFRRTTQDSILSDADMTKHEVIIDAMAAGALRTVFYPAEGCSSNNMDEFTCAFFQTVGAPITILATATADDPNALPHAIHVPVFGTLSCGSYYMPSDLAYDLDDVAGGAIAVLANGPDKHYDKIEIHAPSNNAAPTRVKAAFFKFG